jgi:hypothetical protein
LRTGSACITAPAHLTSIARVASATFVIADVLPSKTDRNDSGRVGDGIDRFNAGFIPRRWQYCLHGCNRRVMSLLIGGTSLAHLTVGQTCAAPSRQAILGWYWWVFDRHSPCCPSSCGPESRTESELTRWSGSRPLLHWHLQPTPPGDLDGRTLAVALRAPSRAPQHVTRRVSAPPNDPRRESCR